jgi:hypothetical protein
MIVLAALICISAFVSDASANVFEGVAHERGHATYHATGDAQLGAQCDVIIWQAEGDLATLRHIWFDGETSTVSVFRAERLILAWETM